MRLAGLSIDDVEEFVRQAGGGALESLPALAESIFVLTGGNAFLLTEVWRALVETGAARRRAPTSPARWRRSTRPTACATS